MKLAIWGYGKSGKEIEELVKKYLLQDEIVCYIDSDISKCDLNNSPPIISYFYLKKKIEKKEIDSIIIPGYNHGVLRDIMKNLYKVKIDYINLIYYSKVSIFEKNAKILKKFRNMLEKQKMILPSISSLEYEVSEICNLNCARCNHYSNLLRRGVMADVQEFKKDLTQIKKFVEDIYEIHLLGGEPLLNTNLDKFVYTAYEIFPSAKRIIITNALLLNKLDDVLLKAIKETNTEIHISLYPPLCEKIDLLVSELKRKGIKLSVYHYADTFVSYLNLDGDSDKFNAVHECSASTCHAFKNGRMIKCASAINIDILNKEYKKNFPDISINLYDENLTGEKMRKYLLMPNELCKFCGKFENHPWKQSDKDIEILDWVSNIKA